MGRRGARLYLTLALSVGACRTPTPAVPRYIVTVTPLNLVSAGHPGLCIAVDPADAKGIWWWEPGLSGCSTRTTGPTIFRAHHATVASIGGSADVEARFRMQLMSGSRDVTLLLRHGAMRVASSGERVSTERRDDLDIPPAFGG